MYPIRQQQVLELQSYSQDFGRQNWIGLFVTTGCLVVRSRFRGLRVSGSKPDSTSDPSSMWAPCKLILKSRIRRPPADVSRKFGEGDVGLCAILRHLTTVQNDKVHPKIAPVLLQNGKLI
ncbi:hypothetical protein AVEN_152419-1 [Araneus ventricosus]|uniref:Uncharacterized protein n=1 Tax=Araneus ventricosus TaxID=182803 RepID=A0A4Y2G650_ARAVE|nr:hypothetical protein AVEN_152419-1 [Araneus ventricosus]